MQNCKQIHRKFVLQILLEKRRSYWQKTWTWCQINLKFEIFCALKWASKSLFYTRPCSLCKYFPNIFICKIIKWWGKVWFSESGPTVFSQGGARVRDIQSSDNRKSHWLQRRRLVAHIREWASRQVVFVVDLITWRANNKSVFGTNYCAISKDCILDFVNPEIQFKEKKNWQSCRLQSRLKVT